MTLALFSAAFLQGLLGSWHCPGMCGPIAHVLHGGGGRTLSVTLLYNFGRTVSYFAVGLALGLAGGALNTFFLSQFAAVLGGVLIVLFGFTYLFASGPGALVAMPEFAVRGLGTLLKNGAGRLSVAFVFGTLSGLLPCGLLYPAYALALGSGQPLLGATAMVFFSLGTYPAMLAVGTGSAWFWKHLRTPVIRRGFGLLMIVFGLGTIFVRVYMPHDHGGHGAHSDHELHEQTVAPNATGHDHGAVLSH